MSQKVTIQKIKRAAAKDITYLSAKECYELNKQEGTFDVIYYAYDNIGCKGHLLKGNKSGNLYKITSRTVALWAINSF